eukprot:TRINITY_DN15737_c0_g1_i1.p1 TRINITY_DN15737_c0_g1~~TRINITY_DN15737_c0_g1_i1.p1  ORF type:complete len:573 (+),score=217.31 TRINITY_DN15737_c0_g1_i1:86-1804(+)
MSEPAAKKRKVVKRGVKRVAKPSAVQPQGVKHAAVAKEMFVAETFAKREVYAAEHANAAPYPHVRVDKLFVDDALRNIVGEAKEHLETTFKETDLFKMFQTLDLANFGESADEKVAALRAKVPSVVKLRDALYSSEFREFVQDVCGVSTPLTERVDMAIQAYSEGGHLLCHDDVIGTRAVSFIIYFTDPDEAWTTEMGGNLELFPTQGGLPAVLPSKEIPPVCNSMVLFKVEPGVTFHAVSETLQDRLPRLSLQGWFHAAAPPAGFEEKSSLSMLKDLTKEPTKFAPLPCPIPAGGIPSLDGLTSEDLRYLQQYIAPEYLKVTAVEQVKQKFASSGVLRLANFLLKPVAEKVLADCVAVDRRENVGGGRKIPYDLGGDALGAAVQGSPVTQRYVKYCGSALELERVKKDLLDTPPMTKFIAALTTLRLLGQVGEVRRFRPGADYTVAYHKSLEPDTRLDAVMTFVEECQGWLAGDIGGFECYIAAEHSELAAAESYGNDEDQDNECISLTPLNNCLSLVARDEHMMRFVKYVSASAPGSRWDTSTVYQIECDATEDEELEECEEVEEVEEEP